MPNSVDLSSYKSNLNRGASRLREALWILIGQRVISSNVFTSAAKALVLRNFGASVGSKVVIKPSVKIKFPWKLSIGDNSWIGEAVWIDNIAEVSIGKNVCISQGAYLGTGNHDWSASNFQLILGPISISDGCWICANVTICPNVTMRQGSIATTGSVVSGVCMDNSVYTGNPAYFIRHRKINDGA